MSGPGVPPVAGSARRVSVPAPRLRRWITGFIDRHGEVVVAADGTTVHLRAADASQAWLMAPFAPLPPTADPVESLLAHVAVQRTVGVVLVRRGGYGVGVFDGSELVASKVGSSYVQGTTKAGGWSQQRYARRRANQARAAFEAAAQAVVNTVLPHAGALDAVVGGGDRGAVLETLADVRLAPLRERLEPRLLVVADPRLRVLVATPAQFGAVEISLYP